MPDARGQECPIPESKADVVDELYDAADGGRGR